MELHVLNLGAGIQSTTLYLKAMQGAFYIDCAIFADVQEEPKAVYAHLDWLKQQGGPIIHVGTKGKLGDDLINGACQKSDPEKRRFASIPAFVKSPTGAKEGRVRRQCTREYKIEVIERVIRRVLLGLQPMAHIPKDVTIVQYFGISSDEYNRSKRIYARFEEVKWSRPVFPLLDWGWSRKDCERWLLIQNIPHTVPRSACVFCPFRSPEEWEQIKRSPEDWARAVQIDEALRQDCFASNRLYGQLYLTRDLVPLQNYLPEKDVFEGEFECDGVCNV